jgi:hypothetical protein
MFDPQRNAEPVAFDAGFAHDIDVAGAFEAPSISDALMEQCGSSRPAGSSLHDRMASRPAGGCDVGSGESVDRPLGFLALWEWSDAWSTATKDDRRAYGAECDVAFAGDLALGINIA